MKKLSLFNKLVFTANILFALSLLFICLNSYLTTNILSPLYILSLFVPILFLVNVFFCLYWILKRKKHFFLSFLCLSIGYFAFGSFYKVNNVSGKIELNDALKVISYNSQSFNIYEHVEGKDIGNEIVSFVCSENAEVVCFQEVSYAYLKKFEKYPYQCRSSKSGSGKSKLAILSKYPIIRNASISFPNTGNDAVYADIVYKNDTIRIYNLHLQSYKIVPSSKTFSEKESERNIRKMVNTFDKQLEQAKIFKEHRASSPYKTLVCGDFNNTQFSNIYRIVRGDYQDSYIEEGKGFGRTYDLKGLPMRIDYIMADESFEILDHQNYDVKLSDHYPIKATLRLKEN
ncbi:endonuclease/exonuclease/phosphatase family protein [Croceitalea sp. MTPC9]|uniref:endonuclease/exonuclease/phosphatase family protein n=1 Tax=unclassified Croceitalea TaxID=2632280 RepID=UPI002B3F80D0|nr:endonuclease/exonuclease/phosphatase family protein [Croceitalea sp. MTPC6]GMN15260.1 endonuclease/exonuclease/phosphatase family protein [Croceitalea sp. MTPC9]